MFKDIAERMAEKEKGQYLNNINEKRDLSYINSTIPEKKHLDEAIKEVAEYYMGEWEKYNFTPEDEDGTHFFIDLPDEWNNKIGNTRIYICPYKEFIYGPWLDSNYMWTANETHAALFIDIYGCEKCDKEYIFNAVTQELYNFTRDAEWVLDGIYESKMLAMEKETDNIDAAWIEEISDKDKIQKL